MTIDVRGTSLLVRDALQVYADQQAGRAAGAAKPLADDLADRIANGLVPTLRQAYLDMAAMQVEWEEESFQAQLADAAANGTLVAGYGAATWQQWGVLLLALQAWLDTPVEALGKTPKAALLKRYIAGEDVVAPVVVQPVVVAPAPVEPEPAPEPQGVP